VKVKRPKKVKEEGYFRKTGKNVISVQEGELAYWARVSARERESWRDVEGGLGLKMRERDNVSSWTM